MKRFVETIYQYSEKKYVLRLKCSNENAVAVEMTLKCSNERTNSTTTMGFSFIVVKEKLPI